MKFQSRSMVRHPVIPRTQGQIYNTEWRRWLGDEHFRCRWLHGHKGYKAGSAVATPEPGEKYKDIETTGGLLVSLGAHRFVCNSGISGWPKDQLQRTIPHAWPLGLWHRNKATSTGMTSPKYRMKLPTGIKVGSTGESCEQRNDVKRLPQFRKPYHWLGHRGEGKFRKADEGHG